MQTPPVVLQSCPIIYPVILHGMKGGVTGEIAWAGTATKDLEREIKKLLAPALCIIDELGYITMSHQDAYSGQIDRLFRRKSIARSDLNRSPSDHFSERSDAGRTMMSFL